MRFLYLSHMMNDLVGFLFFIFYFIFSFYFLTSLGDVTFVWNSTRWIWKKNAHVDCFMKKGKSPKRTSYGPSNFEGDGHHLNLFQ
jgi:hypothetical protein